MNISVVVVNWNGGEAVLKTLRSVTKAAGEKEVWLVDNASTDESLEKIREEFPLVKILANRENLGFARANNQAAEKAKGEYLILLNPDTEVMEETFIKTSLYFQSHPKVGIIGGRLENEDGSVQKSGRRDPTVLRELVYYSGLWRYHEKYFQARFDFPAGLDWEKDRLVDEVSGAYLAIRRKVVEEIGLFDERFFMYYEDADLCLRARKAGWQVVYVPEIRIKHLQGQSAKVLPKRVNAWLIKSALVFARIWYPYYQYLILKSFFILKGLLELGKLQLNDFLGRGNKEDRQDAKRAWGEIIG